ncbi:MAG TPA: inositol monophosphatase family protein [Dehalococcoidia bacterium]|nr:inositol monophosphatase family protein [Dehalococcoidia bacterium]
MSAISPQLPVSASGKSAAEVARACSTVATTIMLRNFGGQRFLDRKGRGNFLTETDLAVERAVLDVLAVEYPGHRVLAEETAGGWAEARPDGRPSGRGPAAPESDWQWVVDPLDGTHNFSRGIPHFCFNIALCYGDEPRLALTYDPMRRYEFFATKGGRMQLNGETVMASQAVDVAESVIGMDMGYDDARAANLLRLVLEIWPGMQGMRVMASAALGLAYASAGLVDIFVHHNLYPWDVAAGILLVQEAGGVILDRDGGPVSIQSEGVVAGAPKVVEDFLRLAAGRPWR